MAGGFGNTIGTNANQAFIANNDGSFVWAESRLEKLEQLLAGRGE